MRVPEQMGIGFQLGTGNNCRGVLFPVKQSVGASVPVSAQFQMMDMPWERTVIGNTEKRAVLTLVDLSSTVSAGTKVYITIEYRLSRGVNADDDDNDDDSDDGTTVRVSLDLVPWSYCPMRVVVLCGWVGWCVTECCMLSLCF